jgi:hypothetical protein
VLDELPEAIEVELAVPVETLPVELVDPEATLLVVEREVSLYNSNLFPAPQYW